MCICSRLWHRLLLAYTNHIAQIILYKKNSLQTNYWSFGSQKCQRTNSSIFSPNAIRMPRKWKLVRKKEKKKKRTQTEKNRNSKITFNKNDMKMETRYIETCRHQNEELAHIQLILFVVAFDWAWFVRILWMGVCFPLFLFFSLSLSHTLFSYIC